MSAAFCGRCKTNWQTLPTQDDEYLDATYEYCPQCFTDTFLEAPRPEKEKKRPIEPIPIEKTAAPEKMPWQEEKEQRDQREMEAIDLYLETYEKSGEAAAKVAYFSSLIPKT